MYFWIESTVSFAVNNNHQIFLDEICIFLTFLQQILQGRKKVWNPLAQWASKFQFSLAPT